MSTIINGVLVLALLIIFFILDDISKKRKKKIEELEKEVNKYHSLNLELNTKVLQLMNEEADRIASFAEELDTANTIIEKLKSLDVLSVIKIEGNPAVRLSYDSELQRYRAYKFNKNKEEILKIN